MWCSMCEPRSTPHAAVQGRVEYADGNVLDARFVGGHVHGPAIIAFRQGSTFYGAFAFNRRQGVAVTVDASGKRCDSGPCWSKPFCDQPLRKSAKEVLILHSNADACSLRPRQHLLTAHLVVQGVGGVGARPTGLLTRSLIVET